MQIWKGALVLADVVLDQFTHAKNKECCLEVGSGTGLAGLIAATVGYNIILTGLFDGNYAIGLHWRDASDHNR